MIPQWAIIFYLKIHNVGCVWPLSERTTCNNIQQMINKCCVLLGKKFGSFHRGLRNKHNYKTFSESPLAFPPYFNLISWRGKQPFLTNRTRTFAWKEPLPIAPPLPLPLVKLDNNLSPRVGDFAQKIIPDLSCPGGGETLGDTLDTSISTLVLYYLIFHAPLSNLKVKSLLNSLLTV